MKTFRVLFAALAAITMYSTAAFAQEGFDVEDYQRHLVNTEDISAEQLQAIYPATASTTIFS
jgi:hypothetical protein